MREAAGVEREGERTESAPEHASLVRRVTRRLRHAQLERLAASRDELFRRLREIPERMQRITNQMELLIDLADDYSSGRYRDVRWYTLGVAVTAALYFVSPADIVPDTLPGIGQLDDILIVGIALRLIKKDLLRYVEHRGLDPAEYF